MLDRLRSHDALQPVKAIARGGGGTDVWIRKNIVGPLTDASVEGFSDGFFEADEAFIRLPTAVSEADVLADFDTYWEMAVAYQPQTRMPTQAERIEALERRLADANAQNAMLTACLLEMSEIVYA